VSRQREFLADASSVQFTVIRTASAARCARSAAPPTMACRVADRTSARETLSHMFLGAGRATFASGLLATHPPLANEFPCLRPTDGDVRRSSVFPRSLPARARTRRKRLPPELAPLEFSLGEQRRKYGAYARPGERVLRGDRCRARGIARAAGGHCAPQPGRGTGAIASGSESAHGLAQRIGLQIWPPAR